MLEARRGRLLYTVTRIFAESLMAQFRTGLLRAIPSSFFSSYDQCFDHCLIRREYTFVRSCYKVGMFFFFNYLPRMTAWQERLRSTITTRSEARLYKRRISQPATQDPTINSSPRDRAVASAMPSIGRIIDDDKLARRSKGFALWFTADRTVRGACQGNTSVDRRIVSRVDGVPRMRKRIRKAYAHYA